jgi:hypothetical protein
MLKRRTRWLPICQQGAEICALFAACLFYAWPDSVTAADGPAISDNDLYENYRRICGQHKADRQMSAMLGCIVLNQDPEGTKQEIRFLAENLCGKLDQACGGSAAQRSRLLPLAEALACGSLAAACGGTGGRALARNYELCGGRLSLSRFQVGGNRVVMQFSYSDGRGMYTANEDRYALFPPPSAAELGGRLADNNRDLVYTIDEMEVLVRQYANEHCDSFFSAHQRDPSLAESIVRPFAEWLRGFLPVQKACDPTDVICLESQKVIRQRNVSTGPRG